MMSYPNSPRKFVLFSTVLAVTAMLIAPTTVCAQGNTKRGAALGGLAGAAAGAIIGENNDEAGAGAAIGGVLGAVTGGLLGKAADQENAYRQQQYYAQQQSQAQQQGAFLQSAVSIPDVISMTRSGLSDGVIINQITQRGVSQQVLVPEVISLHQQGVSEAVITAMQQAPTGPQRVARVPQTVVREHVVAPPPVIVEEHYMVPHYPPPRIRYRRVPVRRHHHIHFGF